MAEAHPVGFRWVMKARERGATVIHVDPRYGRTSASADRHVPIRAGSDIAFLGGLIRHVLETESWFAEYVLHYTNAATILREDLELPDDLGGVFSGFDPETGTYDQRRGCTRAPRDETLQHPRCVLQVLRRHYARYTPTSSPRCAGSPRRTSASSRTRSSPTRAASARAPSATPSAGPSTPRACRSSGRRRSSSCCSATSAGPAAGSWRCAATRRSRARPTSRRSTTCCPATCACRRRARAT